MSNKKNKTALLGIAVALLLPLSFYVIAKVMGKDKLNMPLYYRGADTLQPTAAMKLVQAGELKPAADLQAINQFGDAVSVNQDLPGKMLVVNFFFTSCTSVCPKLTQNIKRLEYAFRQTPMKRNDTMVQFVSITVDPAADTPGALRAYAEASGVDQNHWWFLTGSKQKLFDFARQFHLTIGDGAGGLEDFDHSQTIVLLDPDRFVRGYYNGLDTADVIRCANDMGKLALEKKHF